MNCEKHQVPKREKQNFSPLAASYFETENLEKKFEDPSNFRVQYTGYTVPVSKEVYREKPRPIHDFPALLMQNSGCGSFSRVAYSTSDYFSLLADDLENVALPIEDHISKPTFLAGPSCIPNPCSSHALPAMWSAPVGIDSVKRKNPERRPSLFSSLGTRGDIVEQGRDLFGAAIDFASTAFSSVGDILSANNAYNENTYKSYSHFPSYNKELRGSTNVSPPEPAISTRAYWASSERPRRRKSITRSENGNEESDSDVEYSHFDVATKLTCVDSPFKNSPNVKDNSGVPDFAERKKTDTENSNTVLRSVVDKAKQNEEVNACEETVKQHSLNSSPSYKLIEGQIELDGDEVSSLTVAVDEQCHEVAKAWVNSNWAALCRLYASSVCEDSLKQDVAVRQLNRYLRKVEEEAESLPTRFRISWLEIFENLSN